MAKKIGLIFGVVFLVFGILGFISNPIIGDDGFFKTNTAHDIVHLASGILLILVARSGALGGVLKLLGVIYLLVAVLGFMSDTGMILGLLEVNSASNWLHVAFGIILLVAGMKAGKAQEISPMSNPSMGGMGGTI